MRFNESIFDLTKRVLIPDNAELKENSYTFEDTFKKGFVISPEVTSYLNDEEIYSVIDGLTGKFIVARQWNSTFFDSWETVKNTPEFEKFMHQQFHYLSIFFNDIGLVSDEFIYFPNRENNIDWCQYPNKIFVVHPISEKELTEAVFNMVSVGVALEGTTVDSLMRTSEVLGIDKDELLAQSRNREFSCVVRSKYDILPYKQEDFVRQVVYECTGKTLVIKNKYTLNNLSMESQGAVKLFRDYEEQFGLERLAQVFHRYKPFFLALRSHDDLRPTINKIRRLADKHHKPHKTPYLDTVIDQVRKGTLDIETFKMHIFEAPVFRSVRLLNMLVSSQSDHSIYRVRNGKIWADTTKKSQFSPSTYSRVAMAILYHHIQRTINDNLRGKKVYLPKDLVYAIPTSEKNFVGGIPEGSFIRFGLDDDLLVGVYWEDNNSGRVDLDLSCMNEEKKIGWDAAYQNEGHGIWFSGDVTHAPEGAAEFFRMETSSMDEKINYIFYLNHFTSSWNSDPVDYKITIGKAKSGTRDRKVMYEPVDELFKISDTIYTEQMIGLYRHDPLGTKDKRFYFMSGGTGEKISVRNNKHHKTLFGYVSDRLPNHLDLEDIIGDGFEDVEFVDNPEDADISFAPDTVTAQTFIDLLRK